MDELKKKVEAILFAKGSYISLEEISKICKRDPQRVKEALLELQTDYETNQDSSLLVLNDNDMWKLTTREEFGPIVRSIVSETELTKSQLETLAVIAFKYPIKQADLIKIRTNKAYEHLMELEKSGFITRQRYGRSRLIKLTDKFFEYFDLPREKLKERFKGFEQLAKTIEKKEETIEKAKEEQKKDMEEAKKEDEKEKKLADSELEIDIFDEKGKKHSLEIVDEPKEPEKIEEVEETLGSLEVIDEEQEKDLENNKAPDEKKEQKEESKLKSVNEIFGKKEAEDKKTEKIISEGPGEDIGDESSEKESIIEDEEGLDLLEAEQSEKDKENK